MALFSRQRSDNARPQVAGFGRVSLHGRDPAGDRQTSRAPKCRYVRRRGISDDPYAIAKTSDEAAQSEPWTQAPSANLAIASTALITTTTAAPTRAIVGCRPCI